MEVTVKVFRGGACGLTEGSRLLNFVVPLLGGLKGLFSYIKPSWEYSQNIASIIARIVGSKQGDICGCPCPLVIDALIHCNV